MKPQSIGVFQLRDRKWESQFIHLDCVDFPYLNCYKQPVTREEFTKDYGKIVPVCDLEDCICPICRKGF